MTLQSSNEPVGIVLCGASGRMGKRLIQLISENPLLKLVGAVERPDSPSIGGDAGIVATLGPLGVLITEDFALAAKNAKVCLDFSSPEGVAVHAPKAAELKLATVIGVTALGQELEAKLVSYSSKIPMLFAPNMSFGINLMYKIVAEVAELLGSDYNIEIVEAHHNKKKDAPSGTALMLYEKLKGARKLSDDAKRLGRAGTPGARTRDEIGIHAVRGGDIVGDHTVVFAGPGEVIEVTHRAQSRDAFATGALKASEWIADKAPGLYSFADVLGI